MQVQTVFKKLEDNVDTHSISAGDISQSVDQSFHDNKKLLQELHKQAITKQDKVHDIYNNIHFIRHSNIDELQNQLEDMNQKDDIMTKKRLIQFNMGHNQKKRKAILDTTLFFTFFLSSIFFLALFYTRVISGYTFLTLFVIFFFLYLISSYYFGKPLVESIKRIYGDIGTELTTEGDKLNLEAIQWVDKKCKCKENFMHVRGYKPIKIN